MSIGIIALLFFLLLIIGAPMTSAFLTVAILPGLIDPTFPYTIESALKTLVNSLDSFIMLAIPLFMFSGVIMAKGGISEKLFNIFGYFLGNKTAGYPSAVVITCLFYGAISGSGPATTAAVGAMTIPFLVKRGYSLVFSTSLVAVAGGLGVIIPPSIPMIAYSSLSGASVAQLFSGGVLPGVLIALCLIGYSYFYCKKKGEDKEKLRIHFDEIRSRGFLNIMKDGVWALLTPIIILGSIYSGVATPTEAASISVYYALFVSLVIYKSLKPRDLLGVMRDTVKSYAPILFMISCAAVLSRVISLMQVAKAVQNFVTANVSSYNVVMLMIVFILFIAGMFMDAIPALMIFTPIILPVATSYGIHPVHLGIIMICTLAVGFVTPPVGANLYVASNLTGVPVLKVARYAMPFIIAFMIAILLITFIPKITMIFV